MSEIFEKISNIFTPSLNIDSLSQSCKTTIKSCIQRNPGIENRVRYGGKDPNSLNPQTITECFLSQEKLEIFLRKNPDYRRIANRFGSSSIGIYNEVMAAYLSGRNIEDFLNSTLPPSAISRGVGTKTKLSSNEKSEKAEQIAKIDSQIENKYS